MEDIIGCLLCPNHSVSIRRIAEAIWRNECPGMDLSRSPSELPQSRVSQLRRRQRTTYIHREPGQDYDQPFEQDSLAAFELNSQHVYSAELEQVHELDSQQVYELDNTELTRDFATVRTGSDGSQLQAPSHAPDKSSTTCPPPRQRPQNITLSKDQVPSGSTRKIHFPVCWIIVFLGRVIVGGSLTVGLYFSIAKNQMGDGFTTAGYMLAVGTFVLAGPMAKHYAHCKCWQRKTGMILGAS